MVNELPPPCDLGAPARFTSWRKGQSKLLEKLDGARTRWKILAAPTGSGKSVTYGTLAMLNDAYTVVLTHNKGQQDQLIRDFREVGMVDVRGMSNYPCIAEGGTCDEASCVDGAACELKERGCHYFDAVRAAESAKLRVTNYAFWFTRAKRNLGLGRVDLLICDEAHEIDGAMSDFLKVEFGPREVMLPADAESYEIGEWSEWALAMVPRVKERLAHVARYERKKIRETVEKLERLSAAGDDWVWEKTWRGGWVFQPKWAGPYLERWLWQGVKSIVLASATITPKTVALMGVTKDSSTFLDASSPLPVSRRPVTHVATGVRVSWRTSEGEWQRLAGVMDEVVGARLDRKGIIHSVSYERAKAIVGRSEYRDIMVMNDSKNTREVVERFKAMPAPAVLVSPSVTTGWDFPGDTANYQIVPKMPFPDMRGAVMKARMADDRTYLYYVTLLTLVQMAGRVCRAPDDLGETIVLDDMATWLYGRYRYLTPRWFQMAWRWSEVVPVAPPLPRKVGE